MEILLQGLALVLGAGVGLVVAWLLLAGVLSLVFRPARPE